MAEAFLRSLAGDQYEALSAGSQPAGYVHPSAVAAMTELGLDLSAHTSKDIRAFLPPEGMAPDLVVSVCDRAERDCPVFPAAVRRLHWPFPDPAHIEDDEERLTMARQVRDGIKARIEQALVDAEFDYAGGAT